MANKNYYQVEVVPVGRVRTREFFDGVLETARKYSMEKISFRDLRHPASEEGSPSNSRVSHPLEVSSIYFVFPDKEKAKAFKGEIIDNSRIIDEIWIRELKI